MINPATGVEDPAYVDPNKGIINAQQPAAAPATGIGTSPISSGSVSSQLDAILGNTTTPPQQNGGGTAPMTKEQLAATLQTSPSTPTSTAQDQAKTWDVTKDQTVQGQVAGIIDNKALSPIMERAQAGAAEAANSRGLINSSMGVQAGQAAVLDAAVPIATADAATYADAAKTNAAFGNQYGLAAQQQGFDLTKMNVDTANTLKKMDAQQQNDLVKMAKSQGYDLEKMNSAQVLELGKAAVLQGYETANKLADRETQLQVNKLLTDNKLLVDTNVTAQKALSEYSAALTAISNNKDLSSTIDPKTGLSPRQIAINNAAQVLNNSLTVIGSISGFDLSSLLNFGDSGGDSGGGQPVGGTNTAAYTAKAAADAAAADAAAAAELEKQRWKRANSRH